MAPNADMLSIEQLATRRASGVGDFFNRVKDAGTGLAMDGQNMGDGRIIGQRLGHFRAARRQVVALVDQGMSAAQIAHRLRRAQSVCPVRQDQHLAIPGNEGAQHRLDTVATGALHGHTIIGLRPRPDQPQKARPHLARHGAKILVPASPVAQHRLFDLERRGQRSGGQQIRLAQFRGGKRRVHRAMAPLEGLTSHGRN